MGAGELLRGHAHPGTRGVTVARPAAYEAFVAVFFAGRRRSVYARLVEISGAHRGDRVLDVGCGTGYLTNMIAAAIQPEGAAVGIDASEPVIAYARAHGGASFDVGAAQNLPYDDGAFDVVASSLAVHHLPEDLRPRAVREMYRVVRPGGSLMIAEFRPPQGRLARHLVGALTSPAMARNPLHLLEPMITSAGFNVTGRGDLRPWIHWVRAERPDHAPASP